MKKGKLPDNARLKLDLMFDGIRYSEALGQAAEDAFPNFYPYRFSPGEHDPTGKGKVQIPYLLKTDNDVLTRIKGNSQSDWHVTGSKKSGYQLCHDHNLYPSQPVSFTP